MSKELLWVEKSLIQKLKLLDEVEEIKEKDIKDVIKKFNEDITEIITDNIDSNVLNLRLKAQQIRDSYENVVNEEIEKTNELWEQLDEKRYEINSKLNNMRDRVNSISNEINNIKQQIHNIDFYGIDKLLECIDKINNLREDDKILLKQLFNSHK